MGGATFAAYQDLYELPQPAANGEPNLTGSEIADA
jgi:hypothetical protein